MKINKLLLCLLGILTYQTTAYANLSDEDLRKLKQAGQDIAKSSNSFVSESFNANKVLDSQDIIGFEGIDVRGNNMSLEEAQAQSAQIIAHNELQAAMEANNKPAEYQCDKKHCDVGFSNLSSAKRKENLDKNGFGVDENGLPINNKAYLDKANVFAKNFAKDIELSGKSNKCQASSQDFTITTQDTCDQYYDSKINSCFPRQIVEIDPEYKYACNKIRDEKIKTCHEEITSITCKQTKECALGGIEPGSVASDMKFSYSNGILTIGTIADNYWRSSCGIFDRTTSFHIKDKDLIKDFTLVNVGFDDYMSITLNDHLIYVGPDGGNKLSLEYRWSGSAVNNGISDSGCERGTNWNFSPNIDLRPYLLEGENILKTRVIVAGLGEGWMQIRAKQNCCSGWEIKREEKCNFS